MMVAVHGPPRDPTECYAFAALCCQAFGIPPLHRYDWLSRIDPMNIRLAREGGRVVGGLALVPMGMWLRGARVSIGAMHLVVVAPSERKRGVGRALVAGALRELHAAGTALCVLYPGTEAFYRHAGFHDAGVGVRYRVAAADVPPAGDRVERCDRAAMLHDAYLARARATSGNLDRNPWAWKRIVDPGGAPVELLRVVDGGAYAVAQRIGDDVRLRDVVPHGALFAHLAATGARFIEWNGPPSSPIGERVNERTWFARVCNIERAFASLRVPPEITGTLQLDVRDELIAENAGRWTISIAGGGVAIQRGGSGARAIDIREVAAIVTGHADSILGGERPWMSDVF